MKSFAFLLGGFAGLALMLAALDAPLEAQDTKDEKKTEEKKVEEKKKPIVRAEPSVVTKAKQVMGKIKDIATEGNEITVALVSEQAFASFKQWETKAYFDAKKSKDANRIKKFQADAIVKKDEIYSGDELLIHVNDTVRIRTSYLPKDKKLTSEEKSKLSQPSSLGGYTSEFSALRVGQIVKVYIKPAPMAKAAPMPAKKGPIGADPNEKGGGPTKTDVYMVFVLQDVP
jgi:hypothetical protein